MPEPVGPPPEPAAPVPATPRDEYPLEPPTELDAILGASTAQTSQPSSGLCPQMLPRGEDDIGGIARGVGHYRVDHIVAVELSLPETMATEARAYVYLEALGETGGAAAGSDRFFVRGGASWGVDESGRMTCGVQPFADTIAVGEEFLMIWGRAADALDGIHPSGARFPRLASGRFGGLGYVSADGEEVGVLPDAFLETAEEIRGASLPPECYEGSTFRDEVQWAECLAECNEIENALRVASGAVPTTIPVP